MREYIIKITRNDQTAYLAGLRNGNDGVEAGFVKLRDMATTFQSFRYAEQMVNVIIELEALSFSDVDIEIVELIQSVY